MVKRGLTVVFLSLCAGIICGCAYFEDRARDAADMITVAGEFWTVGAAGWVGRWGGGISGGEGYGFGLRSGVVGLYEFDEMNGTFVGLKRLDPSEADRARGKGYQAGFPLDEHCGGGLTGGWFNLGQVEAVVGVGPAVRAGVNIFEIADFILGWTTVDICNDDPASRRELSALREAGLKSRADLDGALADGATRLHVASETGDVDIVVLLLQAKADVNAVTKDGITPLYWASERGQVDTVKLLLEAGADANAGSRQGLTALAAAREAGQAEIVELLRKRGAKE